MSQTRPPLYRDAPPAKTDAQRLATVERTVAGLPPTAVIWSDQRPDAAFGVGGDASWTFTADGSTRYALALRLSTSPYRYTVTVGGAVQAPGVAYTMPEDAEAIDFATAPPAGLPINVHAPFYGLQDTP